MSKYKSKPATVLGVVGSTTWTDKTFMYYALDGFFQKHGVGLVVSGGAKGADTIGERWADEMGIPKRIHLAKWHEGPQTRTRRDGVTYNPVAGIERNALIVADADVVIAFMTNQATSRGTRNTVERTAAAKKPCFIYDAMTAKWMLNQEAIAWLAAKKEVTA